MKNFSTLIQCIYGPRIGSWIGQFFTCKKWTGPPFLAEPDKHAEIIWEVHTQLPEKKRSLR